MGHCVIILLIRTKWCVVELYGFSGCSREPVHRCCTSHISYCDPIPSLLLFFVCLLFLCRSLSCYSTGGLACKYSASNEQQLTSEVRHDCVSMIQLYNGWLVAALRSINSAIWIHWNIRGTQLKILQFVHIRRITILEFVIATMCQHVIGNVCARVCTVEHNVYKILWSAAVVHPLNCCMRVCAAWFRITTTKIWTMNLAN